MYILSSCHRISIEDKNLISLNREDRDEDTSFRSCETGRREMTYQNFRDWHDRGTFYDDLGVSMVSWEFISYLWKLFLGILRDFSVSWSPRDVRITVALMKTLSPFRCKNSWSITRIVSRQLLVSIVDVKNNARSLFLSFIAYRHSSCSHRLISIKKIYIYR